MKTILPVITFLITSFLINPTYALEEGAPSAWFDPRPPINEIKTWEYGDEIRIGGARLLGKSTMEHGLPKDRQLCFISEVTKDYSQCYFPTDTSVVKNWTTNRITFVATSHAYAKGSLILRFHRYEEECRIVKGSPWCDDELKWGDEFTIDNYKLKPLIQSVYLKEDDSLTRVFSVGETYEIKGIWFGGSKSKVFINDKQLSGLDVVSWDVNSVLIKPSISGTKVRVQNSASKSDVFDLYKQKEASSINQNDEEPVQSADSQTTTFSDVVASHPYGPAIAWGKESGILQGYPDGTFRADNAVNRAEFLKIILESDDKLDVSTASNPAGFPDVDENAWYAPYVRYAKANGIVDGYPDGTFKPEKTVNFAEALKIAYNALDVPTETVSGEWYARFLAHAKYNNVLFTNEVNVASDMTRKDVVWIVWKLRQ